jgi:uncharacterized protein (DUF433 family)
MMGATKTELRDQAAYTVTEAARYLRLPLATLRSWTIGREYPRSGERARFAPLIRPAHRSPTQLSFYNLIEAHVLRSLRVEHGVQIRAVRDAVRFAEKSLAIDRLLLRRDLRAHAGEVFIEKYGELVNLTASGQLAMRRLLEEHLKRIEWDEWQFPVRLYPFTATESAASRTIAIDPEIGFGRPVVLRAGISTGTIAERVDAGEKVADLAEDYGLSAAEIEEAILYERAA